MTAALDSSRISDAVALLQELPDFRLLRRFVADPAVYLHAWTAPMPEGCLTGVYVDIETTGTDTRRDRITELALVPFTFDPDGVVYDAGKGIAFFNDPRMPIPREVTALTGISDDMVAGQKIDVDAVEAMLADAALVVAHHAEFDRPILERAIGSFRTRRWACSHLEVPWTTVFGCRASKLSIVLGDACRQFSDDNHRALQDCHAGVNVLANAVEGGRTALSYLLESARQMTNRVWAEGSPFQKKDQLKARGYSWSPGTEGGGRKCWYKDVRDDEVADEMMFARDIAVASPKVVRFGSKDRFSARVS